MGQPNTTTNRAAVRTMKKRDLIMAIVMAGFLTGCNSGSGSGHFVKTYWADIRGSEFRVNSPDTATGRYRDRPEAQHTGLMTIPLDDALLGADDAELYMELWGGHPGVKDKRVTVNGTEEYELPEVGSATKNCTYSYPTIALSREQLQVGRNEFQFSCHKGKTFWGHYLISSAAIRLELPADHSAVRKQALDGFSASVSVASPTGETRKLRLSVPEAMESRVESVEYVGYYRGYDDNGNGEDLDWHGFTKHRKAQGIIASVSSAPFEAEWDLSMLPDGQERMAVCAIVHFKDAPSLSYRTAAREVASPRRNVHVTLHYAELLPRPFWVRDNKVQKCYIQLDVEPEQISRAELRVLVWDGGKGTIKYPFHLNEHPIPVSGRGKHDVRYSVREVDPGMLRRGANEIRLQSQTPHHGIEVILPGPALIVRTK